MTSSTGQQFTCVGCRIKFDTIENQRTHFKTEWHLYNLKRRVCNLTPIDLESFSLIQEQKDKTSSALPVRREKKLSISESAATELDNEEDWEDVEEIDDEDLVDEEYDEAEAEVMLTKVIKQHKCLFCDLDSKNMDANLKHMEAVHGFFIPEREYLIDTSGFLEYLGFKVGAGATCLWCNKQFLTLHGARLHMLYKDHCKIFYEQTSAIEEFKEFYDYSNQIRNEMKPLSQLAIPRKRSTKHQDYSLAKSKSNPHNNQLATKSRNLAIVAGSFQAKNIKKFDAYRAKILLRTGMANNYTMRGRLRQQNPI